MALKLTVGGFGGLGFSELAFGTPVRGFKPGRSRWIFQGEKILSAPSFGREVKTVGPMSLIYGMQKIPRRFVEVGV
jgi:hypothetical protein